MAVQNICRLDIEAFLRHAPLVPVVDVRSPAEFKAGHIPGAVNIPLFNDMEREKVGITYNKEGSVAAIIQGFKIAGPSIYSKLEEGLRIASEKKLLIHCWRGGMRSEAMAWLFSQGGIECVVLEGGYKSYRHHVLSSLSVNRKMIILGGLTGSGKTSILRILGNRGFQVIDLEGLANHKGSAFGSFGQQPQPTSEHFANLLFEKWQGTDTNQPVWYEDESINIGRIFMPKEFYTNMQNNPAIVLLMDISTRLGRLVGEYSQYPRDELEAAVMKISKRLGSENARTVIQWIRNGDIAKAVATTLKYYDKSYMYQLKNRMNGEIVIINTETDDPEINAGKVLAVSESLILPHSIN